MIDRLRKNSFIWHSISMLATRIGTMFFNFLQGVVISRALLPEGRGVIGLYMTVFGIVFALCGIRQSTAYMIGKQHADSADVAGLQVLASTAVMLASTVVMLVMLWWQNLLSHWGVVALLLILLYVQIWGTMFNGVLSARRDIPALNMGSLLICALTCGILVIGYWWWGIRDIWFYFLAVIVANVASLAYYWRRIVRCDHAYRFSWADTSRQWRNLWPFLRSGFNFALPLLILDLNYQINMLLLKRMNYSNTEIGLYYQAASISMLIWFLPRIMSQVIFAYSISTKNAKAFSLNLWRMSKKIMLLMLPVCLIGAAVTPWLLPFIYGAEFVGSVRPFLLILPGTYVMIAFKVLNGDFVANGHSFLTSCIFLAALLLNIGLDLVLIPRWGIDGASAASSVSYVLGTAVFLVFFHRLLIARKMETESC